MHVLVYDADAMRGIGQRHLADVVLSVPGATVHRVDAVADLTASVATHQGPMLTSPLAADEVDRVRSAVARRRHPLPWVMVAHTPRGEARRLAVDQGLRQGAHEVVRRLDLGMDLLLDAFAAAEVRAHVGAALDVSTARLAGVGRLAAGITRQLSNPTTYVLGNLAVLHEILDAHAHRLPLGPREEVVSIVRDCREGMERLQQLSHEMAVLGRLRAASATTCMLHELVDRGIGLAEGSLDGVRVRRERAPGYEVRCQGPAVVQVIASLVVRVADRTRGREVRVRTRVVPEGAVVDVLDPQAAHPAHELHALLDATRVDTLTGLELVMFRDALRAQGGDLDVAERDGIGEGFQLLVPLAGGSEDISVTPEGAPPPARQRVLVVDDDEGVLRMLRRVLRPHHDVITAASGEEANERLGADPSIAFVLCDLMMPGVDGVGVFDFVSKHRPDLRDRFAILTGGAVTPSTRAFVALSAVPIIDKPVDPDALVAKIRRQITRSQRR